MLNGDGLRVVLWVAGCAHACPGCHNPVTWDPEGGLPFDEAARREIYEELEKDYVSGITFSGGDPGCYGAGPPDKERFPGQDHLALHREHMERGAGPGGGPVCGRAGRRHLPGGKEG